MKDIGHMKKGRKKGKKPKFMMKHKKGDKHMDRGEFLKHLQEK